MLDRFKFWKKENKEKKKVKEEDKDTNITREVTKEPEEASVEQVASGKQLAKQIKAQEKLSESVQLRREIAKLIDQEESLNADLLLSKLQESDVMIDNLKSLNEKIEEINEKIGDVKDSSLVDRINGLKKVKKVSDKQGDEELSKDLSKVIEKHSTEGIIRRILEQNKGEEFKASELKDKLEEKGKSVTRQAVYDALGELIEEEIIRVNEKGVNSYYVPLNQD